MTTNENPSTNQIPQEPNNPEPASPGRPSFLDEILSASEAQSSSTEPTHPSSSSNGGDGLSSATSAQEVSSPGEPAQQSNPPVTPVKKKQWISSAQILRMIGGLLFVSLILFGSFLAYIVFNPDKAKFFINFGINPADVASLLSKLVNGIFGSLSFALSVLFAFVLFRVYQAKGAPKKRAVYIVVSTFVGILLFSNIGFWAYLFEKIGASDFVRPTGWVIVYNNDLLLSDEYKNQAEVYDVGNLLGPITLKYDLSSDVLYASKTLDIEGFVVNCKNNESTVHEWENPANDSTILCTYDTVWNYIPTGYYRWKDRVTREPKRVEIEFDEVKVVGVLDIKKTDATRLFDAAELKKLGKIRWHTGQNFETLASEESKFSVRVQDIEQNVCLEIESPNDKTGVCDRIFTVPAKDPITIQGTMEVTQDPVEFTRYTFKLVWLKTKNGADIEEINWLIGDDLNSQWKGETFENNFSAIGNYKVSAVIKDTEGNTETITQRITIQRSLQLIKKGSQSLLVVTDESGNDIFRNTYDNDLSAYRIDNIQVPQKIRFDATDIRVKNEGYQLKDAQWKFENAERAGLKAELEVIEEKRYDVLVTYIFTRPGVTEEFKVSEKIIVDAKAKEIMPILKVESNGSENLDDLYAEVDVTFDASASKVKSGKISQFIYDFGEGKGTSEGDAIKIYRYSIPGEYQVRLTVVKNDGTKESITRNIVIKEIPKHLGIGSSVSRWIVGKTVEFSTLGTIGQVSTYTWNFGDESYPSNDSNPVHIYEKPGKYTIKLTAAYADGTLRNAEMEFEVEEEKRD